MKILVTYLLVLVAVLAAVRSSASVINEEKPLMLTPLLEAGRIQKARKLSKVKEPRLYNGKSHAGFLTANTYNNLFFWFFPSKNKNAPVLVWLNGGPGVSSMLGVFWENGPVEIDPVALKKGIISLVPRAFSWVGPFSMLYIDNPVGAGYSFSSKSGGGLRLTQEEYTDDLYSVMLQFYRMFPRQKDNALYIGGQSYAGKYVPALAHRIHVENQNAGVAALPLTGIYLGGPLFDTETQMLGNLDFGYAMGFISKGTVDKKTLEITKLFKAFRSRGEVPTMAKIQQAVMILDYGFYSFDNFVTNEMADYASIQKTCDESWVRKALHVGKQKFLEFNGDVMGSMGADFLRNTTYEVTQLLDNYKVLIFNGDYDVIVNSAMIEAGLAAAPWSMRAKYEDTARTVWNSAPGQVKGFYSHVDKFCRVVVHGAGHQTPHDQPKSTREMMVDFVKNGCIQAGGK